MSWRWQLADVATIPNLPWHIAPSQQEIFERFQAEFDLAKAQTIKSGIHRRVWKIVLADGEELYLKHCRIWSLRSWCREWLRSPKAQLEFDRASQLQQRNVGTFEPVGWARLRRHEGSESFLLSRALSNTIPLSEHLEGSHPGLRQRHNLASLLGKTLAHWHDVGVDHPDLHPGNLLLGKVLTPTLYLLDLHAVRLGPPLNEAQSLASLVMLNRYFQLRASPEDRAIFWRNYRRHRRQGWLPDATIAQSLETMTAASNRRFWIKHDRRAWANNRQFAVHRHPGIRAWESRCPLHGIDPHWLGNFLSHPDAPFDQPSPKLKDSRSSTVIVLEVPTKSGLRKMVFKRFRIRSWQDRLAHRLRMSPARRSWVNGHALLHRHLPTAHPWLLITRRDWFGEKEGYLLADLLPGVRELQEVAAERSIGLINLLARELRQFHDRGLRHLDLKAPNLLVDENRQSLWFIDLVGVRRGRLPNSADRQRDLARLALSFSRLPNYRSVDYLRFLKRYDPELGADWKIWWRTIRMAIAKKLARNAQRGRPVH